MMKLSFSTLGCPNYTIDQVISLAADNGYAGIELRALQGTVDLGALDAFKGEGIKETAKKLKDKNIAVVCIGTSIKFTGNDPADRAGQLESAKAYTEMANELECPYLRTFGGPLDPALGYLESIRQIQEGYADLCEITGQAGVIPLLETHDDFSTARRVLEIVDALPSGKIGVIWDVLHPYRHGEPVGNTYELLRKYIRHIHIKDSSSFNASGFDLVLTGAGKVPVAECIGLLENGSYDGFLSFEWEKMWHPEIEAPETAIPHYAKYMRQLA